MAKYASTIGGRIVESREAMGLSQKELAKLMGVSSAVMSHWELDDNKPNAERIVQLCKVLNITASYLLDYYRKDTIKVTKMEETFLNKIRTLSDYDKETVNVLLDRLCERANSNIVEFPRRHIPYYDAVVSAGTGELVSLSPCNYGKSANPCGCWLFSLFPEKCKLNLYITCISR